MDSVSKQTIEQGIKVRDLQKIYFSSKNGRILRNCKKEEKELDKMHDAYKKLVKWEDK